MTSALSTTMGSAPGARTQRRAIRPLAEAVCTTDRIVLAEMVGVSARTVWRWQRDRLSIVQADRAARAAYRAIPM